MVVEFTPKPMVSLPLISSKRLLCAAAGTSQMVPSVQTPSTSKRMILILRARSITDWGAVSAMNQFYRLHAAVDCRGGLITLQTALLTERCGRGRPHDSRSGDRRYFPEALRENREMEQKPPTAEPRKL